MNRKDFLITIMRGIILGALGLISVILIVRNKKADGDCNFNFVCRNCRRIDNCFLPEANQFKGRTSS